MLRVALVLLLIVGAIAGLKGLVSGNEGLRALGGVLFAFGGIGLMVSLER